MKKQMFKAIPTTDLSIEQSNISMLSFGLASLLENLNINEGWNEGQPQSILLNKLLDLQLEINALRESY